MRWPSRSTIIINSVFVLSAISLALLVVSIMQPGWARDSDNIEKFGLWKFCSSTQEECFNYQWFEVPDFLIAVRALIITASTLQFVICVFVILLISFSIKYSLVILRGLVVLAGFCVVMSVSIYAYNGGFAAGRKISLSYYYCFALACVAFIVDLMCLILAIMEHLYKDPLEIYAIK